MRVGDPFRSVHVGSLALCAIFLPWSTSLLSMAQMLLAANWIVEGIVRKDRGLRWRQAFGRAPSLVFMGFLFIHMIGLLWTSEPGMRWGFDLVRILAPVLVFGAVLAGSPRLTFKEFKTVFLFGAWSVLASTVICLVVRGADSDHRDLSMFISHIRLALLLCLCIAILIHFWPASILNRIVHVIAILWALFFIDRLESLQSVIILLAVAFLFIWRKKEGSPAVKWLRPVSLIGAAVLIVLSIQAIQRYKEHPFQGDLLEVTAGGERYVHEKDNTQRENGELVWSNIAWAEVHRTWKMRSTLPLDTLDAKGHVLYSTLFRYMSSLHLPKDSVGIMTLSDRDIDRIVAGTTSYQHGTRWRLQDRIDEVFFELDRYRSTGDASGHSVTMRLEYWRVGWEIFKRNWLFGVGTGDTQIAFDRMYDEVGSSLSSEWRNRAHNQYLTWGISFGIFGAILCIVCLVYPARELQAWRNPLFIAWLIIVGIGSLSDDTVETQAGATLFALYYALLVFAAPLRSDAENARSTAWILHQQRVQ
jgi:hypothetical protein